MKQLLLFFLLIINVSLAAQSIPNVKVYYEPIVNGYDLFVDNNEVCEVSVVFSFDLDNLKSNTNRQTTFIIPPLQKKYHLMILKASHSGKYGFSYKYQSALGNILDDTYDLNYSYNLPYEKGQSYLVSQGYNGKLSHRGLNAIDFNEPEGTPVLAMRSGLVISVEDKFDKQGNTADFAQYNNYILILHNDGTIANYSHLKQVSILVKVGDTIAENQEIALSGQTGWITGPHLHVEVYLPKILNRQTIQSKFKIGEGKVAVYLLENETYKKNY